MKDFEKLISQWLALPDLAEELGVDIRQVHRLIDDGSIIAVRVGERQIRSTPADVVMDGEVVESLKGTINVLRDSGFSDEEALTWLFTADDTLPGTPMNALREGRKTEIRRRAQAMGW